VQRSHGIFAERLKTQVLTQTPQITVSYGTGMTNNNGFLGHEGAIVGYGSLVPYHLRSWSALRRPPSLQNRRDDCLDG
jgi:hypothetical protein